MKCFLYILHSTSQDRYYVGSTTNLTQRFKDHKSGQTYSTHRMGELVLVFSQEFETIKQARRAEQKIKSWKRKDFIKKIVADGRMCSTD